MSHYRSELSKWIVLTIIYVLVNTAFAVSVWAAGFPEKGKVIHILVGYAAGGASDAGARLLASGLEKELGTSVVVVNKPGAGSQIAYTELVRSKPDGYLIGKVIFPSVIGSYLDPARKAIYTKKDFQPLAVQVVDPGVIAVKAESPFKTLKDLINAAKAAPEKITITTTGLQTHEHFAVLKLQQVAKVKFAMVHFKGASPAITAVLGGKVDVSCDNVGDLLPHVKSGGMRILAVLDHQQNPFYPGVKTAEEQGYKIYTASSRGYALPKGTPEEIVKILSEAIGRVIASDEHKKRMTDMGLTLRYMNPDQYSKYWDENEEMMKELMSLTRE